jgi:hypothetical protein
MSNEEFNPKKQRRSWKLIVAQLIKKFSAFSDT